MGGEPNLTHAGVVAQGRALAVGFRHGIWLAVGAMWLWALPWQMSTLVATVLLMGWAVARLWSRRTEMAWEAADLVVVLVFLAAPADPATSVSGIGGSSPVKVAAAAVISFGMAMSWWLSAVAAVAVLTAVFVGFRNVAGLDAAAFLATFAISYLPVMWVLAVIARQVVLRAARDVDASLAALTRVRVSGAVQAARGRYEREQWAILHDTAASTLLLVGEGAEIERTRLAAQASRDLAVLEAGIPVFDEGADRTVDLMAGLAELAGACRTPVVVHGPDRLFIRPAVAWAATAAAREALTNVDRHARAGSAVVRVGLGGLSVTDDGIGGVDLSAGAGGIMAAHFRGGHGIQRSIVERMCAVGGTAAVTGAPGGGTRVELTWPAAPDTGETSGETEPSDIPSHTGRLLSGLGIAIAVIAVVDTLVQSTRAWSLPDPVPPVWVHVVLAAVNVACAIIGAVVVRRRLRTTVLLMTAAATASVLLTLLLPANQVLGGANWSIGAAGWSIVALGLRGPRAVTVTALVAWWGLAGLVILLRAEDRETTVLLGYQTAAILFAQIFTALFAASLYRVVRVVADQDRQRRRLIAAAAVEQELLQDCERRYREQLRSLLPLLEGLATGALDLDAAQVKSMARREYARLRRLFAGADGMAHRLLSDAGAAVARAEARGAEVVVEAASDLPEVSDEARGDVTAALRILLDDSRSRVRIAVWEEPGAVTVSLVCDASPATAARVSDLLESAALVGSEVMIDEESDLVWLRLRCPSFEEGRLTE